VNITKTEDAYLAFIFSTMGQSDLKGQHPALQSKYVFTKNPTVYINLRTIAIINFVWLSHDGLFL